MKTRSHDTILRDLLELVAALDRRVPGLEREGERDIARDQLARIAACVRACCTTSVSLGTRFARAMRLTNASC